jgi:hypothetical protein
VNLFTFSRNSRLACGQLRSGYDAYSTSGSDAFVWRDGKVWRSCYWGRADLHNPVKAGVCEETGRNTISRSCTCPRIVLEQPFKSRSEAAAAALELKDEESKRPLVPLDSPHAIR